MKINVMHFVGFVLAMFLNLSDSFATASMAFSFHSESVTYETQSNWGTEESPMKLLNKVKYFLPYMLGFQAGVKDKGAKITIDIDCECCGKAGVYINDKISFESDCNGENNFALLEKIASALGLPLKKVEAFSGYTIQLKEISKGISQQDLALLFEKKVEQLRDDDIIKQLPVSLLGDVILIPLWLNKSKSGTKTLNYGIFMKYSEAQKILKILKIDKSRAQIKKVRFEISKLEEYFNGPVLNWPK